MADAPDDIAVPRWMEGGLRQTRDELVLFVRTAWAITVRPTAFGRGWTRGTQPALNPLAFFATSLAVSGVLQHLIYRWLRVDESESSLLREILSNVFPYAWYLLFALIVQLSLRMKKLRLPFAATLGVVLFAAGGPATLVRLFGVAIGVRGSWSLTQAIWISSVLSIVFWRSVARALVGALGVHRREVGQAMGLSGLGVGLTWMLTGWLAPSAVEAYLRAALP
jgi:hypothetical protein